MLGGDEWWWIYFGWWWVVVGGGGIFWMVVSGGGWWLICFGCWWMVVGDGGYILVHSLVWPFVYNTFRFKSFEKVAIKYYLHIKPVNNLNLTRGYFRNSISEKVCNLNILLFLAIKQRYELSNIERLQYFLFQCLCWGLCLGPLGPFVWMSVLGTFVSLQLSFPRCCKGSKKIRSSLCFLIVKVSLYRKFEIIKFFLKR